jgi:hypothetical protein
MMRIIGHKDRRTPSSLSCFIVTLVLVSVLCPRPGFGADRTKQSDRNYKTFLELRYDKLIYKPLREDPSEKPSFDDLREFYSQRRLLGVAEKGFFVDYPRHNDATTVEEAFDNSKGGQSKFLPKFVANAQRGTPSKLLKALYKEALKFGAAGYAYVKPHNNSYHIYHNVGEVIGYDNRKVATFIRVELSGNLAKPEIHGHPLARDSISEHHKEADAYLTKVINGVSTNFRRKTREAVLGKGNYIYCGIPLLEIPRAYDALKRMRQNVPRPTFRGQVGNAGSAFVGGYVGAWAEDHGYGGAAVGVGISADIIGAYLAQGWKGAGFSVSNVAVGFAVEAASKGLGANDMQVQGLSRLSAAGVALATGTFPAWVVSTVASDVSSFLYYHQTALSNGMSSSEFFGLVREGYWDYFEDLWDGLGDVGPAWYLPPSPVGISRVYEG